MALKKILLMMFAFAMCFFAGCRRDSGRAPGKMRIFCGLPPVAFFLRKAEFFRQIRKRLQDPEISCGWWITLTARSGPTAGVTRIIKSDGSESPDVAEALSLAKLPRDTQVSGVDIRRNPSANILFHRYSGPGPFAASICFDQPDGSVIYAYFDRYGELVHRRKY
jgi:hypothetical protein